MEVKKENNEHDQLPLEVDQDPNSTAVDSEQVSGISSQDQISDVTGQGHTPNLGQITYLEDQVQVNESTDQRPRVDYLDQGQESDMTDLKQDSLIVEHEQPVVKEKEINYGKEILEMVIYFAIVICSVLFIHKFVGQQIEVSGSSMESTLHNEDHLILEKLSYEFGEPKRYDIVVFRPYAIDENTYYIKRVIGLPGEVIQIIESKIYINGKLLEENYGNEAIADGGLANQAILLGENEYFLLGDNRNNSKDSRDSSIGAVNIASILGRAWVRIWPINDFGVLEHQ